MKKAFVHFISGIAISCTFLGCGADNQGGSRDTTGAPVVIRSLGSEIAYTDNGKGDTTLLFIHGWGIHRGYWDQQLAFFKDRYRVVAIDLPGYGASGRATRAWGPETYAQDVDSVLAALTLKNVILIGHSMSGATVVEAGLRHPGGFLGIVGVDNMKDVDQELTPEMQKNWAMFYQYARINFKAAISSGIDQLYAPTTDSLIRRRVTQDILASDTTITLDVLEKMDQYPFASKLPMLKQPVHLIESAYVPTDTAAFSKLGVKYVFYDMGNVGHYPMLEDPDRFNQLLLQAIRNMAVQK